MPVADPLEQPANRPGEEWRPAVGYEGLYEVSSLGRVRSRRKVLRQTNDPRGRPCVFPSVGSKKYTERVHQLVARAFLGPQTEAMVVCHCDGDVTNNRLSNLRYDTMAGNMADREAHGHTAKGDDRHGKAKLTTEAVQEILRLRPTHTLRSLGQMFGVAHQSVNQVTQAKSWRHVTGLQREH